jgi:hypothetical protein
MTGLMVNKPDDHIGFLIDSLSRVSSSIIEARYHIHSILQCKGTKQSLKWDTFVGQKGSMNNALAPITPTTTPSSTNQSKLNNQTKLDPISSNKKDDHTKPEAQPSSSKHDQHSSGKPESGPSSIHDQVPSKSEPTPSVKSESHTEHTPSKAGPAASPKDEHPPVSNTEKHSTSKPVEPTHTKTDDGNKKDLLKGKPIIFVGGGPGMKQNSSRRLEPLSMSSR